MNWAASLDQIWSSPNLPLYLTLATAGFVGIIVLITLLRSERSVANGVLALVTLLAIGVAGAVTFRGFGTASVVQSTEAPRQVQTATAPLPQLSCIDELAGDAVLAACEKALFGSAESVAAAVAYAASQITLLTSLGDVATANKGAGSDLLALRRAVERDRYGLMAYVLMARDRCTPSACRAFRSLTETRQIAANMEDRVYESLVMRYAASWNAPQAAAGMLAALPPSVPTGKPTNAEFPTSASTPPVNIMTPEPPRRAHRSRRLQLRLRRHRQPRRVRPRRHRRHRRRRRLPPRSRRSARRRRSGRPTERRSSSRRRVRRPQLITTSDLFKARTGRYIGGIMPLHLIKLAVGCESVKELKGWVAERMATAKKKGLPLRHVHITRMTPKRDGEILAGGSLYWVIKGEIAAREKIIAIEPFRDKDGIGRCRLVMQPKVFAVSPRPMRPFQGWRYLAEDAAPPDLTKSSAASVAAMPEPMRRELRDLGLL